MANERGGFGDPTRQTDEFGNPIHQTGAGTTGLGAPGTTGAQGTYDPLGAPGSTGAAPTAAGFDPTSYDPGHGGGQEQLHRPVGGEAAPTRARQGVVDTTGMTTPITTSTEAYGTTGTDTGYSTGGHTGVAPGGGYDTGGLRSTDIGAGDIGGQEGRRHGERKGVTEKVTLTKGVREHLPGTGGGRSF